MISLIKNTVLHIFQCTVNSIIFLINKVFRLFGVMRSAYKKYEKPKREQINSNEKILAAKAEIYGIADRATERYKCEKNVIIIEKFIKPLSDDSKAVSMLKDDENAMETAHSIPVKYIIVEFKNKQRLTFAIADSRVFDMIFAADLGTLTYQGKYWMSFKKNLIKKQPHSIER